MYTTVRPGRELADMASVWRRIPTDGTGTYPGKVMCRGSINELNLRKREVAAKVIFIIAS